MTTSLRIRYCVAVSILFALQAGSLSAQQVKYAPIDSGTIAAYESLGATYVGWTYDLPFLVGIPLVRPGGDRGIPGFYFRFAHLGVSELPEVPIPFAVLCHSADGKDWKGLKDLSGQKHLVGIGLSGNTVTDEKLKGVLDALPQISYLGLYNTKVSEAGIRSLGGRKNIVTISFESEKINDEFLSLLGKHGLLHRLSRAAGKDARTAHFPGRGEVVGSSLHRCDHRWP